jgi:hypothetical protein
VLEYSLIRWEGIEGGKIMKKKGLVFCIQLLMVTLFVTGSAKAADWRFPVGLTYARGFEDVIDIYEDNLKAEGYYIYSVDYWPVGISFHPYVQFDSGFGVGFDVGPLMYITGDREFFNIPISLDFRFLFIPTANTSPYVCVGGRHHLASGDYVEGSTPGFFGGFGIEFLRDKRVNMGIEVSYDSSEIELERRRYNTTEDVNPSKFMVSIFVIF